MEIPQKQEILDRLLKMMNEIIPWPEWVELIRPFYPKGEQGRPPLGIEHVAPSRMLWVAK